MTTNLFSSVEVGLSKRIKKKIKQFFAVWNSFCICALWKLIGKCFNELSQSRYLRMHLRLNCFPFILFHLKNLWLEQFDQISGHKVNISASIIPNTNLTALLNLNLLLLFKISFYDFGLLFFWEVEIVGISIFFLKTKEFFNLRSILFNETILFQKNIARIHHHRYGKQCFHESFIWFRHSWWWLWEFIFFTHIKNL